MFFSLWAVFLYASWKKKKLKLEEEGGDMKSAFWYFISDIVFIPDLFAFLFHFCDTGYLLVQMGEKESLD